MCGSVAHGFKSHSAKVTKSVCIEMADKEVISSRSCEGQF